MRKKYDENNLPKHIAIIMDGNGRWAKKRALPRLVGHSAGVEALKRTVEAGINFGIKIMSFFAFSTENWQRDAEEVEGIFDIIRKYLKQNKDEFLKKDIQIRTMGEIERLPADICAEIHEIVESTKNNKTIIVNIGLSYGGRSEIVRACNMAIEQGKKKITEQDIEQNLYTAGLDFPDFVIRTSGERRLSNFMLYQIGYSELWFPKVFWPDFDKKWLKKAIIEYQKRERRFGKVKY